MNFCPQCGKKFEPEDHFCQECGFRRPTDQAFDKKETVETGKSAEIQKSEPKISPPHWTAEPAVPQKQLKFKPWMVWLAAGAVVVFVAGWLVISRLSNSSDDPAANAGVNPTNPEIAATDSVGKDTLAKEPVKPPVVEPVKTAEKEPAKTNQSEQPKVKAKPVVKTSQETGKPKTKDTTKEKIEPVVEVVVPPAKTKTEQEVKDPPSDTVKMFKVKALLDVGRSKTPKDKNPKNPPRLTIQNPAMIISITTDHYNNGQGTSSAGTFTIRDSQDKIIGTFKAEGKVGENGIPNAKWVAKPNIVLEKGTYTIWDSDMETWSKTIAGGAYIQVEGYEIK